MPPGNSLSIATSCLDKECFKDTLEVALQYRNLPLCQAKSIPETLMLWRRIRHFFWQQKKGSRRKNYTHACTLYQAEGEQMMLENSTAPIGQILTQAFCCLNDPANLSRAAEGTVCKHGPPDITVAQACR